MAVGVESTLSSDAAEREVWDAVIVGAGPAGTAAAIVLSRSGRRVLLLDRHDFPRNKVFGGCLNPAALGMLHDLGVGAVISQYSTPLTRSVIFADQQRAQMPLKQTVFLRREILDAALLQTAIRLGASFLGGTLATHTHLNTTHRSIRARYQSHDIELRCEVLIAADGLGSGMASARDIRATRSTRSAGSRLIGVGAEFDAPGVLPLNTVGMAISPQGYVGMVPLGDGTLHMAACLSVPSKGHFSAANAVTHILVRSGIVLPTVPNAKWTGTPPLRRRSSSPAGERMLLIGDAAGYTEPLTGEGIAWALASGVGAAQIIADAKSPWRSGMDTAWVQEYARLIGSRQNRSAWIGQWARGKRAAGLLVGICRRAPWLATRVIGHLGRTYKPAT